MLDKLLTYDTSAFLRINQLNSPFWDRIMWVVSGKVEWIPLYLALIAYLLIRYRKKGLIMLLTVLVSIVLADQIAVHAFKEVFLRLRPSHNPSLADCIHLVNHYRGGAYGFVSNHAANSFALATTISLLLHNRYFSIAIFLWAALVSYSRIYLGVHYPGDILAGALLGAGLGSLCYYVYQKAEWKLNQRLQHRA